MQPDEDLLHKAERAARDISAHAYAPYSGFRVGAAVVTGGGRLFTGCNVENASYGLTICAERAALFAAVAGGERTIWTVVIYTPTPNPTAPCGACRQVLHEFAPGAEVISVCQGSGRMHTTLGALLPGAFGPVDLTADPPGNSGSRPGKP